MSISALSSALSNALSAAASQAASTGGSSSGQSVGAELVAALQQTGANTTSTSPLPSALVSWSGQTNSVLSPLYNAQGLTGLSQSASNASLLLQGNGNGNGSASGLDQALAAALQALKQQGGSSTGSAGANGPATPTSSGSTGGASGTASTGTTAANSNLVQMLTQHPGLAAQMMANQATQSFFNLIA